MATDLNLAESIQEKIKFGQSLVDSLIKYKEVDGVKKLERKINQELTFLKKVLKNNKIKNEYLQCTNLTHFAALINVLDAAKDRVSVNKVYPFYKKRLQVDIVADNGLTWIKVIARNPRSLSQIYLGEAGYGVRSIVDQAKEFLECAELHPCLFKTPKVMFVFINGIDSNITADLESLGVIVKGNGLKIDRMEELQEESNTDKLNLDVSAMIAYVSSLTNGNCNYNFEVSVLTHQAEWERERPVKPILDKLFRGKRLFCCETAKISFDMIVNTVGGPNEKIRAKELMKQVIVLSDDATVSDTENINDNQDGQIQFYPTKILPVGGKIKQRSKIIFKFGDKIQAMTVTANHGFVRSAQQQGINFVVFIHESRALTEQKEIPSQMLNKF